MDSEVSQAKIDGFLKLRKISACQLSFKGKRAFYKHVDKLPVDGPGWNSEEITITGDKPDPSTGGKLTETVEVWWRDPVDCIEELIGNPMFKNFMGYAPLKEYKDKLKNDQLFNEMWTTNWWWDLQKKLPKGATISGVILSSDKTILTGFSGDKEAYPVYLTIGNIAKGVRRQPSKHATVLLGYLPTTKLLCFSKKKRNLEGHNLFHYCMSKIVEPLINAGKEGVLMTCADGYIRKIFPILAAYVADFPEQCLVACCQQNYCPICKCPPDRRGENTLFPHRNQAEIAALLTPGSDGQLSLEQKAGLASCGTKPVDGPFWATLPHTDMFSCFTPDLLHQIHKGVFKSHVLKWCTEIAGEAELDERFKRLPRHPDLRHFKKGISHLSQWSGTEAKEVEKVFVGLILDAVPAEAVDATRALLDFLYVSQYQSLSSSALELLKSHLDDFHAAKHIFAEYGQHDTFNIPKLHMISHYLELIMLLGTPDGYNTESPERLHIDMAKKGYRASSKKNFLRQMTAWLVRKEKVHQFSCFLEWLSTVDPAMQAIAGETPLTHELGENWDWDDEDEDVDVDVDEEEASGDDSDEEEEQVQRLAKRPSMPSTSVDDMEAVLGAHDFMGCLKKYLDHTYGRGKLIPSVHDCFSVYKRVTIDLTPFHKNIGGTKQVLKDVVRASPATKTQNPKPAFFDTALIKMSEEAQVTGIQGYEVVHVKAIFKLPVHMDATAPPLAYVEHFSVPPHERHINTLMYEVSKEFKHTASGGSKPKASIVPLNTIRCSCHLIPKFGKQVDLTWSSDTIFDDCRNFFINDFISTYHFQIL
ncbi:hypothetical protein BOTBODRAFT_108756 [Botryobasidium botryosum FD-172 SS1]|uniref:Uncharacterized protein n=1 Tax=Botryobasidium botryosum (strain FD-172 SS1) TaxID=930990 RepID=A0A067MI98_BOTB1|nr:hypothetical protein BOTBODRAFT_108756 [Botryobasidium botryosum FD-172 SS1]